MRLWQWRKEQLKALNAVVVEAEAELKVEKGRELP
jgi:hypothetical protein